MRARWMNAFIIAAMLMVAFAANTGIAQAQTQLATYTVAQDDHVWGIISAKCGEGEAFRWQSYLDMPENSSLKLPRFPGVPRSFTTQRGDPGWLIYAGERITLPTSKCNLPTNALVAMPPTIIAGNMALTKADIEGILDKKLAGLKESHTPWWVWALLIAALIVIAVLASRLNDWGRYDYALSLWHQRERESAQRERESMRYEREARKETLQAKDETIQSLKGQNSTLEDSLEAANDRYGELLGVFTDTRKMEHERSFGDQAFGEIDALFDSLGIPVPRRNGQRGHAGGDVTIFETHITVNDNATLNMGDGQTVVTGEPVEEREPAFPA